MSRVRSGLSFREKKDLRDSIQRGISHGDGVSEVLIDGQFWKVLPVLAVALISRLVSLDWNCVVPSPETRVATPTVFLKLSDSDAFSSVEKVMVGL